MEANNIGKRDVRDIPTDELENFIVALRLHINDRKALNKPTQPENDFIEPKKPLKRQKTDETNSTIPLTNSFNCLKPDEIMDTETQQTATTHATTEKPRLHPKPPKIAPIFVKDKEKWIKVNQLINHKQIGTSKCKLVQQGVQIDPATEDDYRKLKTSLNEEKVQYFTYQLRSEKSLKVVMRGIMQEITVDDINLELRNIGYPAEKITRLNGRDGKPAPLVLIQIAKEYKSIYNLTNCCGLAITIEAMYKRRDIVQCHKCQLFGHVQRNCNIDYKCMKCAGNHSTHLCTKSTTTPPKCANCGGEHLSTRLLCPRNPNNPANQPRQLKDAPVPTVNIWNKRAEEKAYQDARDKSPSKKEEEEELASTLGKMFMTLCSTNASDEQRKNFTNYAETIVKLFKKTD